ncbi:MAG: hypothetical protein JWN40_1949 [Phycisphaerales bacterium]|nr:hypothetical protein [Phycisphaerales bacterium]
MARWCHRAVTLLLVVGCGIVVTAWLASYWREDRLLVSRGGRCIQAISNGGRVRLFFLYDYPTPLPWIWEHDEEGRPPGRNIVPGLWRGQGGTVEFYPIARHEAGYWPVKIADGFADTDPLAKTVQAKRLAGVPQFVSPRERLAKPIAPPSVNISDAEIERLIKQARVMDEPVQFDIARERPAKREGHGGGGKFDLGPADGFTLSRTLKPTTAETRPGGAKMSGGAVGSPGIGAGALPIGGVFRTYPRFSYVEVGTPYWTLALAPLSPLVLLSMVRLRRRQVRRLREQTGRCVRCGYDLRETPGVCPECGSGNRKIGIQS